MTFARLLAKSDAFVHMPPSSAPHFELTEGQTLEYGLTLNQRGGMAVDTLRSPA